MTKFLQKIDFQLWLVYSLEQLSKIGFDSVQGKFSPLSVTFMSGVFCLTELTHHKFSVFV